MHVTQYSASEVKIKTDNKKVKKIMILLPTSRSATTPVWSQGPAENWYARRENSS